MIDGMTNEGPCALILGSLVLEPRLHLPLCELEGKREDLTIGRKEIMLLLKSPLKHLDLFWSKPHSTTLWSVTGAIGRLMLTPTSLWTASRLVVKLFMVVTWRCCLVITCNVLMCIYMSYRRTKMKAFIFVTSISDNYCYIYSKWNTGVIK